MSSAGLQDTVAFEAVYQETFSAVYRYACILMGDPTRAEDLAAEVYLLAWRARGSYRGTGTPLSWLLSITHNTAAKFRDGERRYLQTPALMEGTADGDPTAEAALVAADAAAGVRAAIRMLTLAQQQVIVLRFFEDLSVAEVAERLGRQPAAVRALQYRAKQALRHVLNERGALRLRFNAAGIGLLEELPMPAARHLTGSAAADPATASIFLGRVRVPEQPGRPRERSASLRSAGRKTASIRGPLLVSPHGPYVLTRQRTTSREPIMPEDRRARVWNDRGFER